MEINNIESSGSTRPMVPRPKVSEVGDEDSSYKKHSYYNTSNAADFKEVLGKWKEAGMRNMAIPAQLFNVQVASLKLRLQCAKEFLLDHPQLAGDIIDAAQFVEITTKGGTVVLQKLGKITGRSLVLAMSPTEDVPRVVVNVEEELMEWIATNPEHKQRKVWNNLALSPADIDHFNKFLEKMKRFYTGIVNASSLIVVRLPPNLVQTTIEEESNIDETTTTNTTTDTSNK